MANKLYDEESVRAIAEAIRLRNDESADTFTIGRMNEAVLNFPYTNIPSYCYDEVSRVSYNILKFKENHPNCLIFGMGADFHVNIGDEGKEPLSKTSTRHAEFAMDTVGKLVGVDFLVYGGDFSWDTTVGDETTYAMNSLYTNSHIPKLYLIGNHDKSDDTQALYDLIGHLNNFDDAGDTPIRHYGYFDLDDKKVRIICLNTCDYLNASGGHGMSYEQKDWLMRSLDLSEKGDGWQILILSHIPIDFTGGDYNIYADLKAIFDSYVNGGTASITVNSSYALNEDPTTYATYSNGYLTYDFAGKNSAKIIANIHGHIHTNAYGKIADNDIVRMATPNTCYYLNKTDSYTDNGDYSISSEEAANLVKVQDSAKDTCLTFFCIDLSSQVIYAYGYGANTDRSIAYSDATMYTVTLNLSNVVCSNSELAVVEGASYSAQLTVNDGYELQSVAVTMAGVDVTSTVYADGVVDISEVTGDIMITAVAEEDLPYDNLFDESAVQNNTRFNSAGEIIDGSFWTMSTYLAVSEGDVVRVYCPNGLWSEFPQRAICMYDGTKASLENHLYPTDCELSTDDHTLTATIPAGASFIRISGLPGTNYGNVIITINQEIV